MNAIPLCLRCVLAPFSTTLSFHFAPLFSPSSLLAEEWGFLVFLILFELVAPRGASLPQLSKQKTKPFPPPDLESYIYPPSKIGWGVFFLRLSYILQLLTVRTLFSQNSMFLLEIPLAVRVSPTPIVLCIFWGVFCVINLLIAYDEITLCVCRKVTPG